MNILALMGIREGSKGCPNKNIHPILNKPLFTWAMSAANKSRYVNRLVISTDSPLYRKEAISYGIEAPFTRPKLLATDNSPEILYVKHALQYLEHHEGYKPDIVVRLLATVPMQMHEEIDNCIECLLNNNEFDSAVVVSESRQHPMKALRIVRENDQDLLFPYQSNDTRAITPIDRGQYEKSYHRSNVIAFKPEVIDRTNSLTGSRCHPVVIDSIRGIDIDTREDLEYVEYLMKKYNWSKKYRNSLSHILD